MIKFFRHIRQSLLEQKKMRKYMTYAIGEIILVVIGILIALQINNWNENRILKQKELVVLQQLHLDFEANDSILSDGIKYFKTRFKYNELILRNTGPNVTLPKEKRKRDSLTGLNYPKINLVNGSLQISSQQFDLLSNEELKINLSEFPSTFKAYKEEEHILKELALKQRQIFSKYVSLLSIDPSYQQENFKSNWLGVFRDRDFQNITVDKKWNLRGAFKDLNRVNKKNKLILELIKKELDND